MSEPAMTPIKADPRELLTLADRQASARKRYHESDADLIRESEIIEWALRRASAPAGNAGVSKETAGHLQPRAEPVQTNATQPTGSANIPQPREAFADEIKRADAAPPITNPLVLPAGIKAGDYASRSPIPEEPVGRKIAPTDLNKVWQSAEACWASSAPDEAVDTLYYEILRLIGHPVTGFDINDVSAPTKRALKPHDGGNCEHGIAKVNCGICVPSEVFSGGSGR